MNPHWHSPSTMHMGDCSVCGNIADHPNHLKYVQPRTDLFATGERTEMTITATPASPPMTTVHGFAIQVLAFIPIPKEDLKKQIEVSQALIDLAEGRKTIADIVPFMKGIEIRQQHVGKRITVDEANKWKAPPAPAVEEKTASEIEAEEAAADAAADAARVKAQADADSAAAVLEEREAATKKGKAKATG